MRRPISSVVLLKNTLKWKATLLLVLVFLNYMPTCLYVLGGMVPVYSVKSLGRDFEARPLLQGVRLHHAEHGPARLRVQHEA